MPKRNLSLDILKISLAFMVVGIHTSFFKEVSSYLSFLLTNGVFRIAVPIFFLINGYFFHSTTKHDLFKWLKRIFYLYFIWMMIYMYSWFKPDIFFILKSFIIGFYHLWYLSAILMAGILLFYLQTRLSKQYLLSLAIVLFIIGSSLEYIGNLNLIENEQINKLIGNVWIYRNFLFFAFPFFTIGYLIKQAEYHQKIKRETLAITLVFSLMLIFIESDFNFILNTSRDMPFPLLILAPSLFILTLQVKFVSTLNLKTFPFYSNAIYLIHPLIMTFYLNYFEKNTLLTLYVFISSIMVTPILIYIKHHYVKNLL